MSLIEAAALAGAVIFYVLAFGSYFAALVWQSKKLSGYAFWLLAVGFAGQTISMTSRAIAIWHLPVFGTFENALAGSWFIVLAALLVYKRTPWLDRVALFIPPMAIGIIIFGAKFNRSKIPLTISERSLWVDMHATIAWLSYSSFTLAFVVAVLVLIKARNPQGRAAAGLPDVDILDDWLLKYVIYGFVALALTLATGAYYDFVTSSRWWRWDPIEIVTLMSFLLYALFIHLKRSFGWSGNRLAWLAVFSMVTVVAAYWLMIYWPPGTTFHVFDIDTRVHFR